MNEKDMSLMINNINCYNSCLELFYKMTSNSVLLDIAHSEIHTTVNRMPDPYKWLTLENNISILLQYLIDPKNFFDDRRNFISETSLGRDLKKLSKEYDLDILKKSSSYCRQVFSEIMCQSDNKAYGLTFINSIPDLPAFIKQYFEKGFFYNRTFAFMPLQQITLTNIKDGSHFFTRDWKTNLSTHTGVLSQLALIYRCIVLRSLSDDIKKENLISFLSSHISELNVTVQEFLQNTTLEFLEGIKAGELTRKILCFLKSRLLSESIDLQHFIDSKFFYEVYYVPKRQVLDPFEEEAIISFLGLRFKAYLHKEAKKKYTNIRNEKYKQSILVLLL